MSADTAMVLLGLIQLTMLDLGMQKGTLLPACVQKAERG